MVSPSKVRENCAVTVSLPDCLCGLRFVGDPIDVVTGANTDVMTDLAQPGPIPFRWTRYYNSARAKTLCSLGWGHAHHFDRVLIRDVDGLRYQDPLGGAVGFDDPAYVGAAASGMVLTRTAIDSYVITQPGLPAQEFHFSQGSDVARLVRLRQGEFTIELRYTATGTLREIVDSRRRLIRVTSDSAGRILKLALIDPKTGKESGILLAYEYDRAGNLVHATDAYKTTLSFAYDAGNRMTRRTDRRGYSFDFEYDDEGRCIHSRGDDGLLEVFLDYEPDARMTFVRRGDGGQWIYAYNDNKTITQITDPYGNTTKFILDESGRPIQEVDPNGNVTILHYDWRGRHDYRIDPNGNLLPTKDADPNPADPLGYTLPTTALEWDFGHLVDAKTIQPPQANDPLLAPFPGPVVNTVSGTTSTDETTAMPEGAHSGTEELLRMDDLGGPLEQTGPRFTETRKYDVNGRLVEHRDRDGSVFRSVYKSWNALSQSIDPLGNATVVDRTVQGIISKVTDPGGTITEYGYDLREKLVEVREVGRLIERYRRDPAGNIVEKTDASGRTLVSWEVGPGNLDKVQILGSGEKHLFEHNARGRIIKAQTPASTVTFAYDDDGTLLADQRDGKGVVHKFKLRQLVATMYFEKFKVGYRTRANGDLVVQDPTGATHRIQVGKTGLIVKHLANGSRELCQFDPAGRCRRKAVLRGAQHGSLWMRSYVYSAAGDFLAAADTQKGTTKYRHNAAHRLVEETPPSGPARRFEHDAAGNLILQPGLANVVIGEGNRLSEANDEVFTYNDRGNLCQRQGPSGTIHYQYNDLDMLVGCDVKGEAWTASYDGLCRRVQKTWRGQTTTYYWDDFRLAAEVRQNGSCRLYIYADETALAPFLFVEYASLDAAPDSGARYHVFTNQIGAPIRVEDNAGKTVWSAQIDPYGKAKVDPQSTVQMPLRFPGHYFDEETGLHYNRFRYFSPDLGRYLQSDPAGQAGGINVYAYPKNPLTTVDIDGLGRQARSFTRPKSRGTPEYPDAGCEKSLPPNLDDEKVREDLKKKADALMQDIEAARKAGHTHVTAPDGTRLDIRKSEIGPCLSVAYDKKTGNVYYGQNTSDRPTNLREPLQSRAEDAARENHVQTKSEYSPIRSRPGDPKVKEEEDAATKKFLEHGTMDEDKGGAERDAKREKQETADYGKAGHVRRDVPGTHSEVNAVNTGMRDRDQQRTDAAVHGENVEPPERKDYVVYNQSTKDGKPMECCLDCKKVLGTDQPDGSNDVSLK